MYDTPRTTELIAREKKKKKGTAGREGDSTDLPFFYCLLICVMDEV